MVQKLVPESGSSAQGVAKESNSRSARARLGSLTTPPTVGRGQGAELADVCKVGIT